MRKLLAFCSLSTLFFGSLYSSEEGYTAIQADEEQQKFMQQYFPQENVLKIRLNNGLEAYLVSNPNFEQTSIALSVEAGSWNDPKRHPGMAHFLEHLLFFGTEAYPEESDFLQFISDHGGSTNAFTSHDRTVYGFALSNDWFKPGLDRFSYFFKGPLFTPSTIEREMCSVDHEFGNGFDDESIRAWRVLKESGNPLHPHALFSIGNLESLKSSSEYSIRKWFKKHYIANKMHLAIYSPLDVLELAEMTSTCFSAIPSGSFKEIPFGSMSSDEQKGHFIYISSLGDSKILDLIWELPLEISQDKQRGAADLLVSALSYRGENSLSSLLRTEKLAYRVNIQYIKVSKNHLLFDVEFALTEKGMRNTERVISLFYETVAKLKETGIPEYLFEELKEDAIESLYGKTNPFDLAIDSATNMIEEDLATFPRNTLFPQIYDPAFLLKSLEALEPFSCIYIVIGNPDLTGVLPNMVEKWMGTNYIIKPIDQEKLALWASSSPHPLIGLPEEKEEDSLSPDDFIETDPILIKDNEWGKVEFSYKRIYAPEEIELELSIQTPSIDGEIQSKVLTEILCYFFGKEGDKLIDKGVNIDYEMYEKSSKFHVELISSSAENLCSFLATLKELSFEKEVFDEAFAILARRFKKEGSPLDQAQAIFDGLFFKGRFQSKEKLEALTSITYEQFLKFAQMFLTSGYMEAKIAGNIQEEEARITWNKIEEILQLEPLKIRVLRPEICRPSICEPSLVAQTTLRTGSAALLLIEQGAVTPLNWAAQQVLSVILNNAFFDYVRTKHQRAYLVDAQPICIEKSLFQALGAESSTYDSYDLLEKFESFLEHFVQTFESKVSEKRFLEVRSILLKKWENEEEDFEEILEMLDEDTPLNYDSLSNLTYEDLCRLAREFFSKANPRRLAILVDGKLIGPEKPKGMPEGYTPLNREKKN